ncbi:MAG: 30S ribosomal protein S6 [Acidimicrobiales bacterium]
MRPYEVMIILDPTLEDGAVDAQVDRATSLISSGGGQPGRVDRWGKRRLAYEIQHHREGTYLLVEAQAEPAAMEALDRALHLADEVIRHKVIRLPDRIAGRPKARPASDTAAQAASDTAAQAASGTAAQAASDTATQVASGTATQVASGTAAEAASDTAAEAASDSSTSANGA